MRAPGAKIAAVALVCLLPVVASVETARAVCPAAGEPVIVRPAKDSRLMRAHPNANDGASGLVWLKRGSHVRGIIGFDLSCQAAATATVDCANLETTIEHGTSRDRNTFSAHRMLVDWIEGSQSFNQFKFGPDQLGPFAGSGPGTTWDCRVDPDVSNNTSDSCTEQWVGADDCGGGVPCYDPVFSTAVYLDESQLELDWDVTADVQVSSTMTSWLLKVEDESVKSSAVKFFTKEGAQFMADHDPLPGSASHFDSAPRLQLWGAGLAEPTATLVAPLGELADSPATFQITQVSPTRADTARWTNLATGEWGWMTDAGGMDWTATVTLVPGPNEIEFTMWDACGTEGKFSVTKFHGSARALLCYGARTSSTGPDFVPQEDLPYTDAIETGLVDVSKVRGLCVPADVNGIVNPDTDLHAVLYKARTPKDQPAHEQVEGLQLRDRFGFTVLETLRVDGLIAPASMGVGVDPAPLAGAPGPYKCYRSRVMEDGAFPKKLTVHAVDSLEDRTYRIRQTTRVCYPTSPSGGHVEPLLCYRVSRGVGEPRHVPVRNTLRTNDVFGLLQLDTRREAELCVLAEPVS